MVDTSSTSATTSRKLKPVSRGRRAAFAFVTVGFSLLVMAGFGIFSMTNAAAMSALEGFKDVAIWVGVSYIGGSAVDYGSTMLSSRLGKNPVFPLDVGGQQDAGDGGDGKVSD
jgi:hypothetical protein